MLQSMFNIFVLVYGAREKKTIRTVSMNVFHASSTTFINVQCRIQTIASPTITFRGYHLMPMVTFQQTLNGRNLNLILNPIQNVITDFWVRLKDLNLTHSTLTGPMWEKGEGKHSHSWFYPQHWLSTLHACIFCGPLILFKANYTLHHVV